MLSNEMKYHIFHAGTMKRIKYLLFYNKNNKSMFFELFHLFCTGLALEMLQGRVLVIFVTGWDTFEIRTITPYPDG